MHLEPIAQFNDSSMRTARIDDNYRAVIGIIDNNAYLLFVGTHEVAYNWGIRKRLVWNDHTQACQLVSVQQTTEPIAEKTETESMTSSDSVFKDISKEQILKIGVPEDLIPTVMKITSLDDLDPLEDCLPSDAYENIFNLLDGVSINDIIAEIEEARPKRTKTNFSAIITNVDLLNSLMMKPFNVFLIMIWKNGKFSYTQVNRSW